MFSYIYVPVEAKGLRTKKITEHRGIIDKYAQEGYRYIGYIPTREAPIGVSSFTVEIDLIFEKDDN